jgi:TPR repeat protein
MRLSAVLLIALLLACGPARADQAQDAEKAVKSKDYATALKLYQPLADKGMSQAQYWVGYMYYTGSGGLKADHAEALKWFRKAADQGDGKAALSIGDMYSQGDEATKQDYAEAYFWLSVAEKGLGSAERRGAEFLSKRAASHLTPEQKTAADARVQGWKPATTATQ